MRRRILLFLISLILVFPPLSVYFAMRSTVELENREFQAARENRIKADLLQINRLSDESNYLIREQTRLCKEFRMMGEENFKQKATKPEFRKQIRNQLLKVTQKAGAPCEIYLGITDAQNHHELFHAGSEIGLKAITGLNGRTGSELQPWHSFYKNMLNEIILNNNTKIVIREPGVCMALSGEKLFEDSYILALADLSGFSLEKAIEWKIDRFPPRDYGLGAYFPDTGEVCFTDYFFGRPFLKKLVLNDLKKGLKTNSRLAGHTFSRTEFDRFKKCFLFSVAPDSVSRSGLPRQGLFWLIILALFSCILFKLIFEKLVLGRGPDVSFKLMIPGLFLFLIVQPIFASAYLAGEFFRVSYANERNRMVEKLDQDLQNFDRKTFDTGVDTLNLARGLNSIEKIEAYTNTEYGGNDASFVMSLLDRVKKKQGVDRFSSVWVAKGDDTMTGVKISADKKLFEVSRVDNMVAEMFKKRFLEIMALRPDYTGTSPEASETELKSELKQEMSRDFFLKIFGADAFYNFRRNSGIRIEISANYRQEQLIANPIDFHRRPFAYAVWYVERENVTHSLPLKELSLNSKAPRIALHGDEHSVLSVKYQFEKIAEKHPELLHTGIAAHLTRTRTGSITETPATTAIHSALPGIFGNFIIAGTEMMSSFEAFRKSMENRVKLFIAILIFFGGLLAFAGAIYFVWPLRELTSATREISTGNFTIRIHEDHPDEFAALGKAFNDMANGLEEGELLKSFVTDSVRREVEDADDSSLAEKAETTAATVLFAAVCGFNDFQTKHTAAETFSLLQKLLQAADDATGRLGGEIDKMIEDKVMIVFEHRGESAASCPLQAIRAAVMIADQVTATTGMQVAIGINTGMTVAGIMGAEKARLSRTVVGDPVNLAARLAYEAIKLNGGIVISGQMTDFLPEGYNARKLPINSVKGKTQTIEAFEVIRQEQSA